MIILLLLILNSFALLPVVIWHGMGDNYDSKSMKAFQSAFENFNIQSYIIKLSDDASKDAEYSYFGNFGNQVDNICSDLKDNEMLAGGFNAVGLSQGGQFLRAYVEKCNSPPVKSLITIGSQHSGVNAIPHCIDSHSFTCELMHLIVKTGVYTKYVQESVIQAQYYRDTNQFKDYLKTFLADINNEREAKQLLYKERIKSLDAFVMVMFSNDTMVVPKESAWFYDFNATHSIHLQDSQGYVEDWIGLRELDAENKLAFLKWEGDHLQFTIDQFQEEIIKPYLLDEAEEQMGGEL